MHAAEILAGGARLVRTQPKAMAIWGVLYLAAMGAMVALLWPLFGELMQAQQQALAAQAAGAPPAIPALGGFFGAALAINAVVLVLFVAIFAAAVRAVATGGDDPFGFLRFGMDELRLIGLGLLLCLTGFGIGIVVALVFGILFALLAAVGIGSGLSEAGAIVVAVLLYLAILAAMIWAQVRISLAGAYTVLRGRIVIREAWRATRGRFWTLFGVYFLIGFVFYAVAFALLLTVNPDLLTVYAQSLQHPQDQTALLANQQAMFASMFGVRWLVMMLLGTVVNTVMITFAFGAVATAAIGYSEADHAVA